MGGQGHIVRSFDCVHGVHTASAILHLKNFKVHRLVRRHLLTILPKRFHPARDFEVTTNMNLCTYVLFFKLLPLGNVLHLHRPCGRNALNDGIPILARLLVLMMESFKKTPYRRSGMESTAFPDGVATPSSTSGNRG